MIFVAIINETGPAPGTVTLEHLNSTFIGVRIEDKLVHIEIKELKRAIETCEFGAGL